MFRNMFSLISLLFFVTVIFTSCQQDGSVTDPNPGVDLSSNSTQSLSKFGGHKGNVYTMSNSTDGNSILVFKRGYDGSLKEDGSYSTGGIGTGAGLGNQGAVRLTATHRFLLNVNAASNDISIFKVTQNHLFLLGKAPSGGETPISITSHDAIVYVLNAGGDGNISGYRLSRSGSMFHINSTTLPLSGTGTGPAQIEFSPDGKWLAVTEKATNSILIYSVNKHGIASGPVISGSAGQTPFGFAFDKWGHMIVSEAFGGAENASTVSSYSVNSDASVSVISAAIPTLQTAACWIAVTKDGKYAYTTNFGSGSIGGFAIGAGGTLALLDPDGRTGVTGDGSGPLDLAFSAGDEYLYSLNGGAHNISAFAVGSDGSLSHVNDFGALPDGANGLAAY